MAVPSIDLNVIFIPFLSPGHIIPLVDMAKIMAVHGVKTTIITTPGHAPLIQSSLDRSPNDNATVLITVPFPSTTLPDTTALLPTAEINQGFLEACLNLEAPIERLISDRNLNPDCIISDGLCPFTTDIASRFGIPRIAFYPCPNFACAAMGVLMSARPHDGVSGDDEPFLLPGLPHPVRMTRSQIPREFLMQGKQSDYWTAFIAKLNGTMPRSLGLILSSFYDLEPDYLKMFKDALAPKKLWNVGPMAIWNVNQDCAKKGGESDVLSWLDKKKTSSVLYTCFGSLGQFTSAQFREMAVGLEACDCPFIWVVRNGGDESEWMPRGFEDRVVKGGKGLIIRGWVPQVEVLNHRAVGGFATHCGASSVQEGLSAAVPMVTWPLFHDQFFNERLVVDVLKIGIPAGSMVSTFRKEELTLVSGEQFKAAVNEVMGESEEAEERRQRVKKLSEMARAAVGEGGSSYKEMMDLIQELANNKLMAKTKSG